MNTTATVHRFEVSGMTQEDADLLVDAHRELLTAQAQGVRVLGSVDGAELLAQARRTLAAAESPDAVAQLAIVDDALGVAA